MAITILVVDDDKDVQALFSTYLQKEGFSIRLEKDAQTSLKVLEKGDVDLVILDVLIPGMNGFKLLAQIREMPKFNNLPVIMISGIYRGKNHRKEALDKYGALEYFDKPLDMKAVIACLKKHLGHRYPEPFTEDRQTMGTADNSNPLADRDSRQEQKDVEHQSMSEFTGAVIVKGNLQKTPFARILAHLYRWKSSGGLLIKSGGIKKIVYFNLGYPIFIKSNHLDECLGNLLVKERMITEQELIQSVKIMKKSHRQLGTILIEMGSISPHNLIYSLEKQLKIKLFNIFSMSKGVYQFNPNLDHPPATIHLNMAPAAIIYEGIKKGFTLERVNNLYQKIKDKTYIINSDPVFRYQDMVITPQEQQLITNFDGNRTMEELVSGSSLEKENTYQLLAALYYSEIIEDKALLDDILDIEEIEDYEDSFDQPEEVEQEQELDELAKKMQQYNYFQILNIPKDADNDKIRKAYFNLAKIYHPDRHYARASWKVKELISVIFNKITEAYETLINPEEKAKYQSELNTGGEKQIPVKVQRILEAESHFKKGEGFLLECNYKAAASQFEKAISLYKEEGEFYAYLGWSIFQSDTESERNIKKSKDLLNKSIKLSPKVDKSYLFLGFIYKSESQPELAEKNFEKVLQCNPDCQEALQELKITHQNQ